MKRVISLGVGLSIVLAVAWPTFRPLPLLAQANLPLPLPDLILYGAVKQGSTPITEGSITVELPHGGQVTAAIEPVAGTPYTYKVAVPLAMYLAEPATYAPDSVRPGAGEVVHFSINGHPAMLRGSNGAMTDGLEIAGDAAGRKVLVDLSLATAEQSPVGDVNANGLRNSADALLILKYDVGLLQGDDNFPPAPGKIYLSRCDVILDGKCNSSDALRILQCDIRLPNITCDSATAAATALDTAGAAVIFQAEITPTVATDDGDAVVLTVHTVDATAALAATSLRLAYDPSAWQVSDCVTNPTGGLNGGVCNSGEAGIVRFNSVAVQGVPAMTPLAQITLRPVGDAAVTTLASQLTLTAEQAYDSQGVALPWQSTISGPDAVAPTPTEETPGATPETALPAGYQLYLPTIHQGQASEQVQAVVEQTLPVTTTLVFATVVSAEVTPTAPPISTPTSENIAVTENTPEPTPSVSTEAMPPAAQTLTTPTAEATPVPATAEAPPSLPTPEATPVPATAAPPLSPSLLAATPTLVDADRTGEAQPVNAPTPATPVASAETPSPVRIYLPWLTNQTQAP